MTQSDAKTWIVVPAAGGGKRFASDTPKQYQLLCGKPLLEQTLSVVVAVPGVEAVIVPLAPGDRYWEACEISSHPRIITVEGGSTRADSVRSALDWLADKAGEQDWVVVHDAARPCATVEDFTHLRDALAKSSVGGLLGVPVRDTIKQVMAGAVEATVDRGALWHALTPQMFRFGLLRRSLASAAVVTDEASAVEQAGYKPLMVQGRYSNLKVTWPEDLPLAEFQLTQQREN